MSSHRAAGPALANPTTGSVVEERLAALVGQTELERLCGMVLAFPPCAERLLTERRVPDAVLRYTLLAETALRLDKAREAVMIAQGAVRLASRETPMDASRLLPAATVLADAAVVAGAPDAMQGCADLAFLAAQYGEEYRAAVAAGLHAVAVYQNRSCREAVVLLRTLGRSSTESETVAAIGMAIDAIERCCAARRRQHWPPSTRPLITSGGLVQPGLCRPFFVDRILRWPGVHDCDAPARARHDH